MINEPICDSAIIVFFRSHRGEIGSSRSASLSPYSAADKTIATMAERTRSIVNYEIVIQDGRLAEPSLIVSENLWVI